jgi:hypothetical protein
MWLGATVGRSAISKLSPVPLIAECALMRTKRTAELANRFSYPLGLSPSYEPQAALRASVRRRRSRLLRAILPKRTTHWFGLMDCRFRDLLNVGLRRAEVSTRPGPAGTMAVATPADPPNRTRPRLPVRSDTSRVSPGLRVWSQDQTIVFQICNFVKVYQSPSLMAPEIVAAGGWTAAAVLYILYYVN